MANQQTKIVKFRDYLVPLVLSEQKKSTWRLFDDKNLSVDDEIELKEFGKSEHFALAKITKVIVKKFKDLSLDEKAGHETYQNDQQMYQTFSGYYNMKVNGETQVKIIWFKLHE